MIALITFLILILTALILIAVRIVRPSFQYAWLIAAGGAVLAWISIFVWRIDFPSQWIISRWEPARIFMSSPTLEIDPIGWAFSLSLGALMLAIIFTSVVRWKTVTPVAWSSTLILTAFGIFAVLAGNPLTLVLAWTAIDLIEFTNMIRAMDSAHSSERVVTAFSARLFGTGLVLWASIVSSADNAVFNFEMVPTSAEVYMLFAAGLRLGVLPLHLPYSQEASMRRGFGTALRIIPAAASMVLLARINVFNLPNVWTPIIMGLNGIAAIYGSWKWMRAQNELEGRPYWIIGMAALALGAALRGNQQGAASWGLALILFGGIIFLYSIRKAWITYILLLSLAGILSLPFTLTASVWLGEAPWDFVFIAIYWIAHALIVAGMIRHLLRAEDRDLDQQPQWTQITYPAGILILIGAVLLLGLWGWNGALMIGGWISAIVVCVLIAIFVILIFRIPILIPHTETATPPSTLASARSRITNSIWVLYRAVARILGWISFLLESDGGLLWTAVLLVLFISIVKGAQ